MLALPLSLDVAAVVWLYFQLNGAGWSRADRLRWSLAWGPAFAAGLLSCAYFFTRWCGWNGTWPWLLTLLGLLVLLGSAARRSRSAPSPTPTPGGEVPQVASEMPERAERTVRVAGALMLGLTACLLLDTFATWRRAQPDGMWDAMAIWNASARFLARTEADRLPAAIGALREGHPQYPLLLGASIGAQWDLAENESSDIPLGEALGFAFGLAASLHLLLRLARAPRFASAAVLLVFSTPVVWKWAFAQVADLPFAYLVIASALPAVAALERSAAIPPPLLAGFVLGLLPWTKDEGGIVALAFLALFFATLLASRRRREVSGVGGALRRWAGFASGLALSGLAVALFKLTWAPPRDPRASFLRSGHKLDQLLDVDRWRLVAAEFWKAVDPRTGGALWGLAWPLLAVGLVLGLVGGLVARRGGSSDWRSPGAIFLLAAAGGISGAYAVAFVLTPYDLHWQVTSAIDRLMLHVFPLLAAGVLALAGAGHERRLSGQEVGPALAPPGRSTS